MICTNPKPRPIIKPRPTPRSVTIGPCHPSTRPAESISLTSPNPICDGEAMNKIKKNNVAPSAQARATPHRDHCPVTRASEVRASRHARANGKVITSGRRRSRQSMDAKRGPLKAKSSSTARAGQEPVGPIAANVANRPPATPFHTQNRRGAGDPVRSGGKNPLNARLVDESDVVKEPTNR